MNLVYTVLLAFPLGFFVHSRGIAVLSYLLAGSYVFSYQNTTVLLDWPANSSTSETIGYAVVNLIITLAGIGLVVLGHRIARRRTAKQTAITVG